MMSPRTYIASVMISALVVGALLNYAIAPQGNPLLLFGGVLLMGSALCGMVVVRRRRDEPFIVTLGQS